MATATIRQSKPLALVDASILNAMWGMSAGEDCNDTSHDANHQCSFTAMLLPYMSAKGIAIAIKRGEMLRDWDSGNICGIVMADDELSSLRYTYYDARSNRICR